MILCENVFYFYDEVIVLEFFTENIEIERTSKEVRKSYWNILSHLQKCQKSQKVIGQPQISFVKNSAGKNFQLTCFFNEDQKAITPL